MEPLFVYLIKSGALIATFWLAYYFLLRKETFFKTNRWYLLFGLVTSVVLPLVTFKKTILIETIKEADWKPIPFQAANNGAPLPVESFEINWFLVLAAVYGIGISAFLIRFFIDFYSLKKVLKGQNVLQQADFRLVDTTENISPFSYFNYIVFNSSLYSKAELDNILEHEKVHSNQNHTWDVLFARLFCIVFWFNPFVWFYKKSILQNLEFIADSEATKNLSDKKSYQITLLKVTAHENCVAITNHFYQSLIKKRIVMLNKNQSKKRNSLKYLFIVPVLTAFMFYFQVKVVAQEKAILLEDGSTVSASSREVTDMMWTKNTTNEEFKNDAAVMKKSGIQFKFSNIKRNAKGEIIAIKVSYKDKLGNQQTKNISGDQPISPIHFIRDIDFNGKGKIGFVEHASPIFVKTYTRNGNQEESANDGNDENAMDDDEESFHFNFNVEDAVALEAPEAPEVPAIPEIPEKTNSRRSVNIKKPTIIVDGKLISNDDFKILDPETIKEIKVLRSGSKGYGYSYNNSSNDGMIVIDTKKISKEAIEEAKEAMKKARPEMERAKMELIRAKPQMEETKREIEAARKEMEQAREEMKLAKAELAKAKAALEKQKAEQDKK